MSVSVVKWALKCYFKTGLKNCEPRQTDEAVLVFHLEDFKVVLRFFYQVSDGKVHSLSVPEGHKRKTRDHHVQQLSPRHAGLVRPQLRWSD